MAKYEWVYYRLHGVGRFVRVSDGALSPMYTGTECEELNTRIHFIPQEDLDELGAREEYE